MTPTPQELEFATTCLLLSLQARDLETGNHAARVQELALQTARALGLGAADLYSLKLGALLHDLGKIATPDAILKKPDRLTPAEWHTMHRHPLTGSNMLRAAGFPEGACLIVEQHHERFDGHGYPFGLRGEQITLGARIFAVADTFDAITRDRCYRLGAAYVDAYHEITMHRGTQFDPAVVDAFISHEIGRPDGRRKRAA